MPLGCHSDPLPGASLAEEMEELAQMEATEATTEAGTGLCGYPLRRVDDLVWGFYPLVICDIAYWKWPFIVDFPINNGDCP